MFRFPIAISLLFSVHEGLVAQTSTYRDGGTKHIVSWNELVGKIVTVDGLAWGAYTKGFAPHLVLPAGRIYVHDVDYLKHDLNGRLLRVSGFLRKSTLKQVSSVDQEPSEVVESYYIESFSVERIDKVQHDQLLPSPFEWIVLGGKTEDAIRALNRLKYQEVLLALARKPGSIPHAYRVSDTETLFFYDSGARIESLTRIKRNDPRKRNDDEWVPVKAIQLKSEN